MGRRMKSLSLASQRRQALAPGPMVTVPWRILEEVWMTAQEAVVPQVVYEGNQSFSKVDAVRCRGQQSNSCVACA